MVESPLLVKPYLERMSRADLFLVMTAGLSTIAGTVFVLYSTLLQDVLPNAAGHLLTASVLSAPAAVVVARLMIPTGASDVQERIEFERRYDGALIPSRRKDFLELGMKSLVAGNIATLMTGAVAALVS